MAVLGEAQCVLHAWLRAGNTSASRGISHFLSEALALLPAGWKVRTVRADSGFCSKELLKILEERGLTYIVVARLTGHVRRKAVGLRQWIDMDGNYAVSEFEAQLFSCVPRRENYGKSGGCDCEINAGKLERIRPPNPIYRRFPSAEPHLSE